MRVLVTGASGNIGRAVSARLAVEKASIAALVLTEADAATDRFTVVGDAGDPDVVRRAIGDGVDAVVHLAAIPAPTLGTPIDVFAGNTRATFNVLEECARAGVRRAVIASSYSILGLRFAPRVLHPAYYPIDEQTPFQIEDPYSLSKQADEATAAMMHRRYGMDIVALRFPYTAGADQLARTAEATRRDPAAMAPDSWSYLHVDDAAEAVWRALTRPLTGFHPLLLAAPLTLADQSTMDLIRAHHPSCEIRADIPGRQTPINTAAIERLLGFQARWTL
ncbi:NAD-dependent epimerase/dehydratase family protein [Dactylosporangium sp. NPDC051541]|uniref:NAD-dependent epimerase/dehydratase family protein n=1 Tax=Dactylosporangium sp. NPDC051541 TaxID=3363977 RepID=UPI00379D3DBA